MAGDVDRCLVEFAAVAQALTHILTEDQFDIEVPRFEGPWSANQRKDAVQPFEDRSSSGFDAFLRNIVSMPSNRFVLLALFT